MSTTSNGLRRRQLEGTRDGTQTRKHSGNVYLDVTGTVFHDGVLRIDTADGVTLGYRCGSRPLRVPPSRLRYSESTYRSHEEHVRRLSRKHKCAYDSPELGAFFAPGLARWAGSKSGLDILELGPAHTTEVPDALEFAAGTYTAVDFSPPFLSKQIELLSDKPELLARSRHIVADTYDLSLPADSCDLVVVSCHPPLVSASPEDKIMVIGKIHTFLRPGGVFALFPWFFEEQQPEVSRHLLQRFALRHVAFPGANTSRLLLFLEKR